MHRASPGVRGRTKEAGELDLELFDQGLIIEQLKAQTKSWARLINSNIRYISNPSVPPPRDPSLDVLGTGYGERDRASGSGSGRDLELFDDGLARVR